MSSGKREILFKRPCQGTNRLKFQPLPCGQCIGCRLERSRQWAMRCMDEASLYSQNSFITLTYSDENLPSGGTLVLRDWQLFMKRLRKLAEPGKVRFFACGEYGEKLGRPHYHACLFGFDFSDKIAFRRTKRGDQLWRSTMLESVWTAGQSLIGSVTFESAAYVARYVMKKVTGEKADGHYVNKVTGELRLPEFVVMSLKPGIGRAWYDKFKSDVYPRDFKVMRGVKVRPPKFYDRLYELENPEDLARLKHKRVRKARDVDPSGLGEFSQRRLLVKEEVKRAEIRTLSRNLEVDS